MIQCPNCGSENEESSRFCTNCAGNLPEKNSSSQLSTSPSGEKIPVLSALLSFFLLGGARADI